MRYAVCSVLSVHDQQHSVKTGPGPGPVCLCPVVKCVISGVKGWRLDSEGGGCANSDICEDTGHGVLTPRLWSVLRLHKSVQLSRAGQPFS